MPRREESSSAASAVKVGRRRKWRSKAAEPAIEISRSSRERAAGRSTEEVGRHEARVEGRARARIGGRDEADEREEGDAQHDEEPHVDLERGAVRRDGDRDPEADRRQEQDPSRSAMRAASTSGPLTQLCLGVEPPLLCQDLGRAQLRAHRLQRLDRLVLHLRRHIVSRELRP